MVIFSLFHNLPFSGKRPDTAGATHKKTWMRLELHLTRLSLSLQLVDALVPPRCAGDGADKFKNTFKRPGWSDEKCIFKLADFLGSHRLSNNLFGGATGSSFAGI